MLRVSFLQNWQALSAPIAEEALQDSEAMRRSGRLLDATVIEAPSSTRNRARARDPEMSST